MVEDEFKNLESMDPKHVRNLIREGRWTGDTEMVCRGYVQANLVIVPLDIAFDFLTFCVRNPRLCPVLDVTDPGSPHPRQVAPQADVRTDLPKYRVFKNGEIVEEPTDITHYWRDDLVAFVLGCSLSFEWTLRDAGIPFRFPGAYATNIECVPAGVFHGPVVATCRLFETAADAVRAIQISSRHILSHGAPLHVGDPGQIGIKDICDPDMGRSSSIKGDIAPPEPNEISLFWGCGVTAQAAAITAGPSLMITHYPGCMLVTDKLSEELVVL